VAKKHVPRYFKGTMDYGLNYERGDGIRFIGYTYSDWEGCVSDRKCTSGFFFGLGSTMVSWFSRKKNLVALSSVEVEYMEANHASCEAIWICKLLVVIFGVQMRPTMIYCDN
jgi:hypothetical protein